MTKLGDLSAKHASEDNLLKRIEALEKLVGSLQRSESPVRTLEELTNSMGLMEAGEFRSGNGVEPGSGFDGLRMGYPGFVYGADTYHLVGVNNDTLQVGISATDGKIYAAGGDIILDETGLSFTWGSNLTRWQDTEGDYTIKMYGTGGNQFYIENFSDGADDDVEINFRTSVEGASGATGGTQALRMFDRWADGIPYTTLSGSQVTTERLGVEFHVGPVSDGAVLPGIKLVSEGQDGGQGTHIHLGKTSAAPTAPYQDGEVNIYQKDENVVLQYNDGGTVRYKFLDMTNTATHFGYSTSDPGAGPSAFLGLGALTTETISGGAITITSSYVQVEGQGGAADNLDTINGGNEGDIVVLTKGGENITIRHNQDNIRCNGSNNQTLNGARDKIPFIKNGSLWHQMAAMST